jgi:hypothetical protein
VSTALRTFFRGRKRSDDAPPSTPPVEPAATTASLVEQANELASTGQVLAAIDRLQGAGDGAATSELEVRLVELRSQAIDELPPTGLDSWPRTAPDPFPDVVGRPPEVGRDELDATLLAGAIAHHGSLIVRGLVDPADVAKLHHAVDQAFAARDDDEGTVADRDSWYHPFEQGSKHKLFPAKRYVRIIDSPRSLRQLIDVYQGIGLVDIVTEHLGERPALSAHKCALRRLTAEPGEQSSDYHQDGAFLGKGIRTVNAWLALSPCGGDIPAPGIDIVPRRVDHILDTGVDGAHLDWTASEAVVERAAMGMAIVRPVFQPGDALLFDELMVHRTGFSDGMTDERTAIESWFFAPSVYPDDHVPLVI